MSDFSSPKKRIALYEAINLVEDYITNKGVILLDEV